MVPHWPPKETSTRPLDAKLPFTRRTWKPAVQHIHWVQSKRHRLWFSTKTCSCNSTKTYEDSLILSSNWIWLRWETNTLKYVWCSTKTTFNVYVSQRSQIQFEDEDHVVYMSVRWVTTTLSSLRTTACYALIVPSDTCNNQTEQMSLLLCCA